MNAAHTLAFQVLAQALIEAGVISRQRLLKKLQIARDTRDPSIGPLTPEALEAIGTLERALVLGLYRPPPQESPGLSASALRGLVARSAEVSR